MKSAIALLILLCCQVNLFANVRLPKIIGNNMVLQRDKPIKIWGWADPKEKIKVTFNNKSKTTKADASGKWRVLLDAEQAGGPFTLVIDGNDQIALSNILIGEVWVCSGQSNMEMPIGGWGEVNNFQTEISNANYPMIRHIKVPRTTSEDLKEDITDGHWEVCSPSTAGEFSATAYFFARQLYQELKIPIGLVNTSWGGSQSEAWTSQHAFALSEDLKYIDESMKKYNFNAVRQHRYDTIKKAVEKVSGLLPAGNEASEWAKSNFDDRQWPAMKLPDLWENNGLALLDGVVWFRKTVDIMAQDAGKNAVLELSTIDEIDETFVNGVKVGSMAVWNEKRTYSIPNGLLIPGINVIAVRVTDLEWSGGIYGAESDMKLTLGNSVLGLSGDWKFKVESIQKLSTSIGNNDYPSVLFNAMINPLLPMSIRGVIWYQGETNAGRAHQYRTAFPLLINDWRTHWKQGNFPFLFVQLSSFGKDTGNSTNGNEWAELREAQAMTLTLPNTGMAVTTDIGDAADIHPKNKQDVGKRLAVIALHDVYEKPGVYTGPQYQSIKIDNNQVILSFNNIGSGWRVEDKYGYLRGFEIAGVDKQFYFAKAEFEGDKIVVYCDKVPNPVAVRYAWANDGSVGNLFNSQSFPLGPFRTDNWKGSTDDKRYLPLGQ